MRGGKRSTSIRPGEVRNPQGKNQYVPGAAAASKKIIADVKELAKEYTAEALERIVGIMRNDAAPPAAVLGAAIHVLDRGWGKARETVEAAVHGPTLEDLILSAARRRVERDAENEAGTEDGEKLH